MPQASVKGITYYMYLDCNCTNALCLTWGCEKRCNDGQRQENTAVFKLHGEETVLEACDEMVYLLIDGTTT